MRDFVIGSSIRTRSLSFGSLSEPLRDRFTVIASPPAKAANSSVPLASRKLSSQISPPRSPTRSSRIGKSPNMGRSPTTNNLSIGPAQQNILVDSSAPQNTSEQPKHDSISVPPSRAFLFPTAASTVSFSDDCPRIDLIALVRDRQKAKKVQKKKPSGFLLREEPYRYVDPRGSNPESLR